jgi:hypothetical protein
MALTDAVRQAQQSFGTVMSPPFVVVGSRPDIVFPLSLRSKPVPFISFTPKPARPGEGSGGTIVHLPMPPGISFNDAMSYSSIDLGIIGQIGTETITEVAKQTSLTGALGAGVGALAGSIVNKARKLNAAAAGSIIARYTPGASALADNIDFSTKQVIAPNTNTTFQNSTVRQFQFTFKLIGKSEKEAKEIDRIVSVFRIGMYPKGNDVILQYPSIWKIDFNDATGSSNTFIPKIFSCYLTSMNAVYNGSTNLYHGDGSPIETDISLQFQETRPLTQDDILQLGGQASRQR